MRDSRTRSFSAVGMQGAVRTANRSPKRNLLITSLAVVLALIVLFTVLIFGEIFGWFEEKNPGPADNTNVGGIQLEYEDKLVSTNDAYKGDLILINSSFPYTFPETTDNFLDLYSHRNKHEMTDANGNRKTVYSYYTQNAASCAKLESKTLSALNAWTDDFYRATGEIDLFIYDADGYRTEAEQAALNASNPTKYVAAGLTEHHTGKAVDLYIFTTVPTTLDDSAYAGTYRWLYDNAHKYGFIERYPSDKADVTGVGSDVKEQYHFRYVGIAHATYMYQNDLCLEEYLDLLRDNYKYGEKHLEFKGENGVQYVVYYVKASFDSSTTIPVPKTDDKTTYEISGDNKEGFIVTVTIEP